MYLMSNTGDDDERKMVDDYDRQTALVPGCRDLDVDEMADTERPVPLADAPCDAPDCKAPWHERVEWEEKGEKQVRFACKRHAYLYLMSTTPPKS